LTENIKATILFIDDEYDLIQLCTKMLIKLGHTVITATSPIEGLEKFKNNKNNINIIITDYTMPLMNGIEFAEKIRELDQNIPIIISTGQLHYDYQEYIDKKIINGVLNKPYRKKELSNFIQTFFT
jgi:CheY-like chemotaxis protein